MRRRCATTRSGRMKCRRDGVALIVTLWVILVLSLLVAGFAFSTHVELQVASYNRKSMKADALARSGLEVAGWLLISDSREGGRGVVARNQGWVTNTVMLVDHQLGEGSYTVRITDEESKIPVNTARESQLKRLMEEIGLTPMIGEVDGDVIVDSILDWIDDNDLHRLNGAEDEYYRSLPRPYRAKNAPLDRIEELLSIRGVTPEIYLGSEPTESEEGHPGLRDVLTSYSTGRVNINTASSLVLSAWLGVDRSIADQIVSMRAGEDGQEGTEDDRPFQRVEQAMELMPGLDQNLRRAFSQILTVDSRFFTIHSTGEVGGVKRTIVALVQRDRQRISVVTWQQLRN